MSTPIQIVERRDCDGYVYYTPVKATPSGDGTMAAELCMVGGSRVGPRFLTRAGCQRAIDFDAETRAAIA